MVYDEVTKQPIENAAIQVFNLTKPLVKGEDILSTRNGQYINHDITSSKSSFIMVCQFLSIIAWFGEPCYMQ
jgi:hypothetical protein